MDGHIRGAELKLLGVHQVPGAQVGVGAEGGVVLLVKGSHMGIGHAAGFEHTLHRPLGDDQRFGLPARLVLLDHTAELLVDGLDHLIPAVLGQGVPQDGLKSLLLGGGGHGDRAAEHGVHEFRMVLRDVPGVVEGVVEVGAAVVKGGEEKAQFRRGHDPVGSQGMELIFMDVVAQGGFGQLHRTDAAQDVGVDLRRGVGLGLAVSGAVGHVIGVVSQQDEVVAL